MKNGYSLSRAWFDFAWENPDLVNANHTALFMWFIEKWNRCGQPIKFSVTTSESMTAVGIKSRHTYSKVFKELADMNFIDVIKKSANQHQCSVISLVQKTTKQRPSKLQALDQALIQATSNQGTIKDTINQTTNNEQINNEQVSAPTLATIFLERNGKLISELETELLSSEIAKSNRMMLHGISKEKHDDFAKKFIAKIKSDEWWNGRSDAIRYFGNMIKTWLREEKSGRKGSTAEPFKKKTFDLSSPS